MREFDFFISLPRAFVRHSTQISVPRARSGLSAHLTARPTAVAAVTLRREVSAVPRASFCSSRHTSSMASVGGCAERRLCSLSAQYVCTAGFLCAESWIFCSRQSVPVPRALDLAHGTEWSSRYRLRFR
jgi:hypothetical protein